MSSEVICSGEWVAEASGVPGGVSQDGRSRLGHRRHEVPSPWCRGAVSRERPLQEGSCTALPHGRQAATTLVIVMASATGRHTGAAPVSGPPYFGSSVGDHLKIPATERYCILAYGKLATAEKIFLE